MIETLYTIDERASLVEPEPKPAWVYVFSAAHATKVGVTQQSVRRRALRVQSACGARITIVDSFECASIADALEIEGCAHWVLKPKWTTGEWFACSPEEAVKAVREAMNDPWTQGLYDRWKRNVGWSAVRRWRIEALTL